MSMQTRILVLNVNSNSAISVFFDGFSCGCPCNKIMSMYMYNIRLLFFNIHLVFSHIQGLRTAVADALVEVGSGSKETLIQEINL